MITSCVEPLRGFLKQGIGGCYLRAASEAAWDGSMRFRLGILLSSPILFAECLPLSSARSDHRHWMIGHSSPTILQRRSKAIDERVPTRRDTKASKYAQRIHTRRKQTGHAQSKAH